jgi:hypothetical protein
VEAGPAVLQHGNVVAEPCGVLIRLAPPRVESGSWLAAAGWNNAFLPFGAGPAPRADVVAVTSGTVNRQPKSPEKTAARAGKFPPRPVAATSDVAAALLNLLLEFLGMTITFVEPGETLQSPLDQPWVAPSTVLEWVLSSCEWPERGRQSPRRAEAWTACSLDKAGP